MNNKFDEELGLSDKLNERPRGRSILTNDDRRDFTFPLRENVPDIAGGKEVALRVRDERYLLFFSLFKWPFRKQGALTTVMKEKKKKNSRSKRKHRLLKMNFREEVALRNPVVEEDGGRQSSGSMKGRRRVERRYSR